MYYRSKPRSVAQRHQLRVGGVPFEVTSLDRAVDDVIAASASRSSTGTPVRLSNAYCVALAGTSESYREILAGPGMTFPDGAPVALYMRWRTGGSRGAQRVRGPSLFVRTLDRGRTSELQHFFLGTTEDTLALLVERATSLYPGLEIAGTFAPPFGPIDEALIVDCSTRIAEARPDIVWIALSTPKQDVLAAELAVRMPGVFVSVGAAFDFLAGTVREAPTYVQTSGFEWTYRLFSEPRRLWRRYLFGNARFIWQVARRFNDV